MRHFFPNTLGAATGVCCRGNLSFLKKMKPETFGFLVPGILFGLKQPTLLGNRWLSSCWRTGGLPLLARNSHWSPYLWALPTNQWGLTEVTWLHPVSQPSGGGWDQLGQRANVSDGCHDHVGKEVEGRWVSSKFKQWNNCTTGCFLNSCLLLESMQCHLVEPFSSEIATENVKNVVGEDVHTSTSSKTAVNNCTVCLAANLLTQLFLSFLICNRWKLSLEIPFSITFHDLILCSHS